MYGISIQDISHQDNFALLFTWNLFCSAEYYNTPSPGTFLQSLIINVQPTRHEIKQNQPRVIPSAMGNGGKVYISINISKIRGYEKEKKFKNWSKVTSSYGTYLATTANKHFCFSCQKQNCQL
jgi:hypothetical protein